MKEDFGGRIVKERLCGILIQIESERLKEKACGDVESHFRPFFSGLVSVKNTVHSWGPVYPTLKKSKLFDWL